MILSHFDECFVNLQNHLNISCVVISFYCTIVAYLCRHRSYVLRTDNELWELMFLADLDTGQQSVILLITNKYIHSVIPVLRCCYNV